MPLKNKIKNKAYHQKWWAEHREEMKVKRDKIYNKEAYRIYKENKIISYNESKQFLREFLFNKRKII